MKSKKDLDYTNKLVSTYLLRIVNKNWFPEVASVIGRPYGPKFVDLCSPDILGLAVRPGILMISYNIRGFYVLDEKEISFNPICKRFALSAYDEKRLVDELCPLIPTRPDLCVAQQKHPDLYNKISKLGKAYINQKSYSKQYVESLLNTMLQYK